MYDLSTIIENQKPKYPLQQSFHSPTISVPSSTIPMLHPSTSQTGVASELSKITFSTPLPYTLNILVGLPSGSPFHIWDTVLKIYTTSKLTHGTDKLVAISGIARELAPRMNCQYVAGLWEKQLARQLLWISRPAKLPKRKNDGNGGGPYHAPSWSWASTDELLLIAIQWDWRGKKNQRDFLIDVLDIYTVQQDGHDNFGQVKEARLRLRGRMIEVNIVHEISSTDVHDAATIGSATGKVEQNYQIVLDGVALSEVTFHEDGAIEYPHKKQFCVPICVSFAPSEFSLDSRILVHGLVLEETESTGCFRRIGVFDTPYGTDFLAPRSENAELNRKNASELDWGKCKQWHGGGGRLFGNCVFVLI